jgi:hypothetical protein
MQDLKTEKSKTNYLVETIEFELGVIVNNKTKVKVGGSGNLLGIMKLATEGEHLRANEMIHKVRIKLEPKKTINNKQ